MFFRKKQPLPSAKDEAEGSDRLFIHFSEHGWSAIGDDPAQPDVPPEESGETINSNETGVVRTEAVIRMAARNFSKRKLAAVKSIHILLDDPIVQFADVKSLPVNVHNPTALCEFGARYLNVPAACYGSRNFGIFARSDDSRPSKETDFISGERKQDGIYAFMDARQIRSYLSLMGDMALKVANVTPVGDLLLRRSETKPNAAYAALYIAADASYFALANSGVGSALVRTIPIGLMTLVGKVAEASSVAAADALAEFHKRDYFSAIRLSDKAAAPADMLTDDLYQRTLAPLLKNYFSAIAKTLDFFETQRISNSPPGIEVFGDLEKLKGLKELLVKNLGVPAIFPEESLIHLFHKSAQTPSVNLLSGATDSLLTVGKTRYTFSREGFVSSAELARESLSVEKARLSKQKEQSRVSRLRKTAKKPDGGTKKNALGGLSLSFSRLFSKNKQDESLADDGALGGEAGNNDRQYFILFGAVIFGLFYLAWMQFDDIDARFNGQISTLHNEIANNYRFRTELSKSSRLPADLAADINKVLWSEKFLAIASDMNEAMWLTDVYLSDESREIGSEIVVSKKLTLEGAVLPSVVGHVLKISDYIDRLIKDEPFFMSDFREITFEGAYLDAAEEDHVVRFAIAAWYDKNKRVNALEKEAEANSSPLENMQNKVDKRTKIMDKSVGGGG